jgi:uncharacterized delta-60 repeat protein
MHTGGVKTESSAPGAETVAEGLIKPELFDHSLSNFKHMRIPVLLISLLLLLVHSSMATVGEPGTLDTTFGTNGKSFVSVSPHSTLADNDVMSAMAIQANDKVLLSGLCRGPGASTAQQGCLIRLDVDGTLDTRFNLTGMVHGTFAGATVRGEAILVMPDGRIVMSGGCGFDFCAVRFLSNGTLDTSFGNAGLRRVSFSGVVAGFTGADRQADGRMVFGGYCSNTEFCVIRLTRDGDLDTSFGSGAGFRVLNVTAGNEFIRHVRVEPDGKIVAAGQCNNQSCILRLTEAGELDTTFNTTGFRTGACFSSTDFYGFVRQPDGRYLATGTALVFGNISACIVRFNADGSSDNTFAGGALTARLASTDTVARDVVLQNDGRIILIAKCGNPDESICMRRYHTNGTLDLSFATASGNLVRTEMISGQPMLNLLRGQLDSDARLVVGAGCKINATNDVFCVARYDGGPFAYQNCSADIDGDGQVLPTTDALLLARAAQGIRGVALVNGIQFPVNAKRNSSTAIAEYLSVHCGVPRH